MEFDFNQRMNRSLMSDFVHELQKMQKKIGFQVSARGWCYLLETERLINKNQFDKVENVINKARRDGYLPIDFVAEEAARQFKNVVEPDLNPKLHLSYYMESPYRCQKWYEPNWWRDEKYYIQMIVEKIDLVTLFLPVCEKYHIPIANSKGWSSMLQRAEYARRFKEAEDNGLECVLLYCGDHDPDGLRISDFITKNLEDLRNITWEDGMKGYDPENLIIERFGLNDDFIEMHGLTWIDNLITGSGKNLASPVHKNFRMPYVQEYLKKFGERKCEANAIVPIPDVARSFVEEEIKKWIGEDALDRFKSLRDEADKGLMEIFNKSGASEHVDKAIMSIDEFDASDYNF